MLQGRKPIWIKVDPQTLGSRSFTVGMEDIPPGDSIGIHKHLQEDEIVFVHRGAVEVTLGDSTHSAQAGGLVFIPRSPIGTTFVPPSPGDVAAARKDCHQVRRMDVMHQAGK
jgi:mannose-6-phosphate isomerase-like protein (cupin superfamily)